MLQAARRSEDSGHVPALDGLRGLAICLVLWLHAARLYGDPFPTGVHHFYQQLSYSGVDLFFVLSGFLITSILLETRGTENYLLSFYARRGLRIWPLYYVIMIGVFLFLAPVILRRILPNYASWIDGRPWNLLFMTNFYLARQGHWISSITDVTWSVCIEEQFYIVWPFAVMLLGRRGLKWFLPFLICTAVIGRIWIVLTNHADPWFIAYLLPVTRMDGLAAGALIATRERRMERDGRSRPLAAALGLAAALALASIPGHLHGAPKVVLAFSCFAAAYSILLCIPLYGGRTLFRSFLEFRVMRYLGKISYGLYLYHLIVGSAVRVFLEPRIVHAQLRYVVGAIAMVAGSIAIASVSWYLMERPVLSLKRFFPRPVRLRRTAKTVQVERRAGAAELSAAGVARM